jgi:hypothetical protein
MGKKVPKNIADGAELSVAARVYVRGLLQYTNLAALRQT